MSRQINKKLIKVKEDKNYFSAPQLVKQPWFPIKTTITLRKLIDSGELKAVNVSTNPKLVRYHIHKKEVVKYMMKKFRKSLSKREIVSLLEE